jgi:HK97 family phage major capsid protein
MNYSSNLATKALDHHSGSDTDQVTQHLGRISTEIKTFTTDAQKEIRAGREKNIELQARLSEVEQQQHRGGGGGGGGGGGAFDEPSPFDAISKDDRFQALARGATSTGRIYLPGSIHALTKAITSFPTPASVGAIVSPPKRAPRLLDFLTRVPVTTDRYEFVQLSGANNAAVQALGALKSEGTLTTPLRVASIATVANYIVTAKQILSDNPSLIRQLAALFSFRVMEKLEALVIAGTVGADVISGLLTESLALVPTATTPVDIVSEAQASLDSAGFSAGAVVLNPMRWHAIRTERSSGDGQYLSGSWNQPATPNIWTLPVVTSPAVPLNTAIVYDPAVVLLLDREQAAVLLSTEDRDNFVKNMCTVLAEVRAGLAVLDPAGVVRVTLPAITP